MNARTVVGTALVLLHLVLSVSACAQPSACAPRSSGGGARIEEASFVPLGGIEQFVTIRGDDRTNPVLLHIHGGPGIAFSAFTAEFAPYEADFTVVQWDQRGAGCTFGRSGEAPPDLTLDRLASDGIALAEYLRSRLGGAKIIVLGHSFGTIVGTDMVRRAPERFALYVGTAQFGRFARIGAQTAAVDVAFMQRLPSRAAEVMGPEQLAYWQAGRQASMGALMPQVAGVDLLVTARRFEVPFVIIQGSDDPITPTDVATAYFEQVSAPAKEFVIIGGAGHFPHLTHTPQFLAALREHSRAVR